MIDGHRGGSAGTDPPTLSARARRRAGSGGICDNRDPSAECRARRRSPTAGSASRCAGWWRRSRTARWRRLRPDPEHPLSKGFACPKGIALAEVQNDPDRVLHPLRRPDRRQLRARHLGRGAGRHRRAAATAIRERPRRRLRSAGTSATRAPSRYSHPLWVAASSTRSARRTSTPPAPRTSTTASSPARFLYGSPFVGPDPRPRPHRPAADRGRQPARLARQRDERAADQGRSCTGSSTAAAAWSSSTRGARRPRARSSTCRSSPTATPGCCSRCSHVIFEEGLEDAEAIERQAVGADALRELCAEHPPEATEDRTGVPAPQLRELARALARAERAAIYGRTGSCLGRSGTLVSFLLDALNLVTGNLDREGGAMFGDPPIDFESPARPGRPRHATRRCARGSAASRGARIAARVADGEGDHDPGQGPDPRDVRLRRQPGAVGPERRRARGRARRARPDRSRSTSTSTTPRATATTCCRRRRCTSARTSRSRSRPCSPPRSSR